VGNDRKREKKAEKAQTKEVKVSKFDGKFLNDTIFSRRQKQDEVEVKEVFAIEKGAPITWIRGRKDKFIVTQKDKVGSVPGGDNTSDIKVKVETGTEGKEQDDDVEYIGRSSTASGDTANYDRAYFDSLTPFDVDGILAWDDDDAKGHSNEVHEPIAFSTPPKRSAYHSRPLSPVTRKKIQFSTPPSRYGANNPRVASSAPRSQATQRSPVQGASCDDDGSQREWVRPQTMAELFELKKRQMDQKAKWAVAHALRNSRTV
jgi:hypothetical protein